MSRTADEVVVDVIANVAKANADLKQYAKTSEQAFSDAAKASEAAEKRIAQSIAKTNATLKQAANQNAAAGAAASGGQSPIVAAMQAVAKQTQGGGATKGLDQIVEKTEEVAEKLGEVTEESGLTADSLVGVGLAAAAVTVGLAAMTFALDQAYAALAFADELQETADKLDTTAESFQALQYAAMQADVSNSNLIDGLENLKTVLGSMVNGTASKQTIALFKALGISKDDLRSIRDVSELLPILAERIGRIGNEAQQADVAKRLGIEELLPLLKDGRAALDGAADGARNLGLVIDNQTIKSVAELNDRLEVAQKRIDIQLKEAFLNITPAIVGFTEAIADGIQKLNEFDRKSMAIQNGLLGVQSGLVRPENLQNYINAQLYDGGAVGGGRGRRGGIPKKTTPFNYVPPSGRTGSTRDGTLAASAGAQAALDQAAQAQAQALAGLTQDIRSKADAQIKALEAELKTTQDGLKAKRDAVNADKTISAAKKKEITDTLTQAAGVQEIATAIKIRGVNAEAEIDLAEKALQRRRTLAGIEINRLEAEAQLAKTAQERAVIEGRILTIQKELDDAARANKRSAEHIRANAVEPGTIVVGNNTEQNAADGLDAINRELQRRAGLSPLDAWREDSIRNIQEVQNAYEELTIRGIDGFNKSLADAIVNGKNFGDAFGSILKKLAADFIVLKLESIQSSIFSGKDGSATGLFDALFSFLPGRAGGGPANAGQPYIVGEKRPEVFVPDVAGRIIPSVAAANSAFRGGGAASSGGAYFDFRGALTTRAVLAQVNRLNSAASSKTLYMANRANRKSLKANLDSVEALGK